MSRPFDMEIENLRTGISVEWIIERAEGLMKSGFSRDEALELLRVEHEQINARRVEEFRIADIENHRGYAQLLRYGLRVLNQLAIANGGEDSGEPPCEYIG